MDEIIVPQWLNDGSENTMDFGESEEISIGNFLNLVNQENYEIAKKTLFRVTYDGESSEVHDALKKWDDFNTLNKFGLRGLYLTLVRIGNHGEVFNISDRNVKRNINEISGIAQRIVDHFNRFDINFKENFKLVGVPDEDEIKRNRNTKMREAKPVEHIATSSIEIRSLNTILEGVAGCGKTYYQKSLFDVSGENKDFGFTPERSETVVFHPSTSYEDFVSGLRPVKDGKFKGKAGIFVELCNRAAVDPKNNYLLFIDEINRANTAKVFGDLLMVIEEAKRTPKELLSKYGRAVLTRQEAKELQSTRYEDKDPEHAAVRLQTAVDEVPGISKLPEEPLEYLAVPNNLYIVGTMNSTDRSVGTIDLALRRRFTWHTMEPMTMEQLRGQKKVKHRADLNQLNPLLSWYDEANEKLYKKVGPDARLGHSYFFQGDKSAQQIAHDLLKLTG